MKAGKIDLPTWHNHQAKEINENKISVELSSILDDIVDAGAKIGMSIRQYGLWEDITGSASSMNLHGDHVKKLDLYANEVFTERLKKNKYCAAIVSEEDPEAILAESPSGRYLVFIDPLDGSSNIDTHVSTGSIFSVYEKISDGLGVTEQDLLQSGNKQVAAGYILYSSSTVLLYAAGHEVHGFTYYLNHNMFYLTHPDIQTSINGTVYSINEGNCNDFPEFVNDYLNANKSINSEGKSNMSLRYVGSMVADMHRNILKGGIFLYPGTAKNPKGKLRLMYECNPFAYLIEKSGGRATDGLYTNILDIIPEHIHVRSSIVIGSAGMMNDFESFVPNAAKMDIRRQM